MILLFYVNDNFALIFLLMAVKCFFFLYFSKKKYFLNLERKCDIKNNRPIIKTSSSYAGECFDKNNIRNTKKDFQEEERSSNNNTKNKNVEEI